MSLSGAWLLAIVSTIHAPIVRAEQAVALRGTLVQSDAQRSQAILELNGSESWLIGVGSTLPGVGKLVRVESLRVLLERNGSLFELSFSGTVPKGPVSAAVAHRAVEHPLTTDATDDGASNTVERVAAPAIAEEQTAAPVDRSGDAGLPQP